MGTFIEVNDTLQLTTAQGFPAEVFDYQKHHQKPITLSDVGDKLFTFRDKPAPRIYQLDPVRVYFVHNIDNKWLFWGHVLIQSLEIKKQLSRDGSWDGKSWLTSGAYRVVKIYEPEYQRIFTTAEAPEDRNFFK